MTSPLPDFDLANLPTPGVVEVVDVNARAAEMLADLRTRDPAFTATVESDPAYKLLEAAAYQELLLRERINSVARRRLLAFATGHDLDHLAAFYGVQRMVVDPGSPNATPPVLPTYESDDRFITRVRERIRGSSAAGTASWYRYHAMSAHPDVAAVAVDTPSGGRVRVAIMATGGAPSSAVLSAVAEVVGSDDIRALCHTVSVVPAVVRWVDVSADVTLLPSAPATTIADLQLALADAFASSAGLGWDVTASWVAARLMGAGVYRVSLVSPASDLAVAADEFPALRNVELRFAGRGR